MERAKRKGFTQPASTMVKPIENQGRNMYPLFSSSISYAQDFVNSDSMKNNEKKEEFIDKLRDFFYIGKEYKFDVDDDFEIYLRRLVRVKRFKRIVLCALIALSFTGMVLSISAMIYMFMGGVI